VGRGTAKPFEVLGAPWIDEVKLSKRLKDALIDVGLGVVPIRFVPQYSKYRGEVCRGIHLIVRDKRKLRPVTAAIRILSEILHMYEKNFEWVEYRLSDGITVDYFTLLIGDPKVRKLLENNVDPDEIAASWEDEHRSFLKRVERIKLYE